MNFWVKALYYNWAKAPQVRIPYSVQECTKQDLQEGVSAQMVTPEEYQIITDEPYAEPTESEENPAEEAVPTESEQPAEV